MREGKEGLKGLERVEVRERREGGSVGKDGRRYNLKLRNYMGKHTGKKESGLVSYDIHSLVYIPEQPERLLWRKGRVSVIKGMSHG